MDLSVHGQLVATKRVLQHEIMQAHSAADDERAAARNAVFRSAVVKLLSAFSYPGSE